MPNFLLLTTTALIIEACVGYPDWLWRAIGHPVSWIGRIIGWTDGRFNRETMPDAQRRWCGVALIAGLLALVGALMLALQDALLRSWAGSCLLALLASSLLAQRSLFAHVRAVADALDRDLEEARREVAKIVGRDVQALDASGVARAAVESLAENFADGVVAPALWMAIGGLPGAALYKAVNTADSMIGHRTPRHLQFGWAAARLDDVLNWPAARLAGLLLAGAALANPGASARGAVSAMGRDARHHRSPNAGWPEAALAGALGLRLAGPRSYDGIAIDDAFMGSGRRDARTADIRAALVLYRRAIGLLWLLFAIPAIALL